MKSKKLYKKLISLYEKFGAIAVYDYASKHVHEFESEWQKCQACEECTPTIKGEHFCSVCGNEHMHKPNSQPKGGGKVIVKCKCKCNSEEKGERVFLVRVQYINKQEETK